MAVTDMVAFRRRAPYHGVSFLGSCLVGGTTPVVAAELSALAAVGSVAAVGQVQPHTVAMLACPEMSSVRLGEPGWDLEKSRTGLCTAPTLPDVAGLRTTIRGAEADRRCDTWLTQLAKGVFNRTVGALRLVVPAPLMVVISRWQFN